MMQPKKRRFANRGMAFLLSGALILGCIPSTGTSMSKAAEKKEATREDNSIVYFVDCGDYVTDTVCKGDQLGTRNSVTDQAYGEDAATGYKWGIVDTVSDPLTNGTSSCGGVFTDHTWPYESNTAGSDTTSKTDSNRYTKNQYEDGTEIRYIDYKFELAAGTYELETYCTDPWSCSKSPTLLINSADATADFKAGKGTKMEADTAVKQTVTMEQEGELTVSFRGDTDDNKAINVCYIKITDPSKVTPPDEKDEDEVKKAFGEDVSALKFTLKQVASDLVLPTEGENGSSISWVSSNEDIISTDGTVNRPAAGSPDAEVTLEATISMNDLKQKKLFTFTVLAESSISDIQQFNLDEVEITDDYYLAAQDSDIEFLKKFDNDRLLSRFRETAGLDTKGKKPYGGWEDSNLGGHCVGHYLSACAQAIKATGDEELKTKLEEIISGLKECQDELGTGFIFGAKVNNKDNVEYQFDVLEGKASGDIWVPWYNMHKMVAGLVDTYKYTGNQEALDTASALGTWVYNRVSQWSSSIQGRVLGTEYGGMNDCLYDLYSFTGDSKHLEAAHKFDQENLFKEVASGKANVLNGKHANTAIPKFMGALKRYMVLTAKGEATDSDEDYLTYAEKFWNLAVDKYSYITGGVSVMEHFRAEDQQDHTRTKTTCESCCAHNMLKIARELYKITGEKKYSDYYESTLRNSIMGAVKEKEGAAAYFIPMATGYFKTFGDPDPAKNMFWCCTGSGMENFTKLGDSIYFHKDDTLIVNQYVASRVKWNAKNLEVTQTSDVTKSDVATLKMHLLNGASVQNATVALRVPEWACKKVTVKVNGIEVKETASNGYISVKRDWKENDEVTIQYPMEVEAFGLPDNNTVYGFKYGPTVLAAKLGTARMTETTWAGANLSAPLYKVVGSQEAKITVGYGDSKAAEPLGNETLAIQEMVSMDEFIENINTYMVKDTSADTLTFKLSGTDADENFDDGLTFVPFNTLNEERYGIYWYFESPFAVADESQILAGKENGRLGASKIDSTQPGYGQYENDQIHQLSEKDSVAGTIDGGGSTRHAKAGGYFTYNFVVNKDKTNSILCQFAKEDNGKTIKISVGDTVIAEKTLNYTGEDAFYSEYFKIPADVLSKSMKILQIAGDDGKTTEYTVVPVKFESASATEDSARLVGGLSMTVNYNNNAAITAVTASNGEVRQTGETFTVYLPAETGGTKLKFEIADRYGLLYINDELINDTKAQQYLLTEDTTTLKAKVYGEDHETAKEYTIKILRGVEAPVIATPTPVPTPVPAPTQTPSPAPNTSKTPSVTTPSKTTKKKKASIKITGKKKVKKGKSITLKAKLTKVSGKVKWSVNKKKLAKITSKGKTKAKLKGLKKGKVKVTAKIKKVKKTIKIKIVK